MVVLLSRADETRHWAEGGGFVDRCSGTVRYLPALVGCGFLRKLALVGACLVQLQRNVRPSKRGLVRCALAPNNNNPYGRVLSLQTPLVPEYLINDKTLSCNHALVLVPAGRLSMADSIIVLFQQRVRVVRIVPCCCGVPTAMDTPCGAKGSRLSARECCRVLSKGCVCL